MMLCIPSRPAMAFFLVSLNSGSDFRLRHLSEVKISIQDYAFYSHFWTCPRAKDFPRNSPCSHERMTYVGEWVRTQ